MYFGEISSQPHSFFQRCCIVVWPILQQLLPKKTLLEKGQLIPLVLTFLFLRVVWRHRKLYNGQYSFHNHIGRGGRNRNGKRITQHFIVYIYVYAITCAENDTEFSLHTYTQTQPTKGRHRARRRVCKGRKRQREVIKEEARREIEVQ